MKLVSSSRSLFAVSFLVLGGAGLAACGGSPSTSEASDVTRSADTALCSATTSCSGIIDGPPVITITCDTSDKSYLVQTVSPGGTTTYAGVIDASSPQYAASMSSYGGSIETCQWEEVNWGTYVIQSTCQYFSIYTATMCGGAGGSSGGGTHSGGKNGCKGTCQ